jgi:hypothetical protein
LGDSSNNPWIVREIVGVPNNCLGNSPKKWRTSEKQGFEGA